MEGTEHGGGAPDNGVATPEPTTAGAPAKTVPYDRFKTKVDELATATARIQELEAAAGKVDTYRTQRDSLRADLQLADLGLSSSEGREVARTLHGLVKGDDKPNLDQWFQDVGRTHPALSGYLASAGSTDAPAAPPAAPEPPVAPAAPPPRANAETRPPAPTTPVTKAALEEAQRKMERNPTKENADHLRALLSRFMDT